MVEFWRSDVLPHVESRRSCQENSCYRPHAHDSFSIGLIDAGTSIFTGALGGPIRLTAGDVVTISSGQVHACNPERGPWRYQMIHLDEPWATSLAPVLERSPLFAGVTVLRHPDLYQHLSALNEAIFADESAERVEAGFRRLFHEMHDAGPAHHVLGAGDPELSERLQPVMHRLLHDEANPSLEDLAGLMSMTTYQLIRAMKRATGLTPVAWRQNARIVEARRMLRDGRGIAETAHALGFSDQSHFHRVFRAHVAASPGAYRA